MLFGLDIASHQGYPDFPALKAQGHAFVISKVTGEGNYVNPYWRENLVAAIETGLLPGSYDWVRPQEWASVEDAVAAARDYLRVLGALSPGHLLTVDFEDPEWHTGPLGRDIEAAFRAYCETLKGESGCAAVIIYTAPYFLAETGASGWAWLGQGFVLWQAAPGEGMMADDSFWPATPAPFAETALHQHQWHATGDAVPGAEFDRDRYRGTVAELAGLGYIGDVTATQDLSKGEELDEMLIPDDGKVTAFVTAKGKPIFIWNAGGETTPDGIVGINIQDLGMTVKSATEEGVVLDRSIQHNEIQLWRERRG